MNNKIKSLSISIYPLFTRMKFDCILFRVEIYSASSGFGFHSSDCHSSLSVLHFPSLGK